MQCADEPKVRPYQPTDFHVNSDDESELCMTVKNRTKAQILQMGKRKKPLENTTVEREKRLTLLTADEIELLERRRSGEAAAEQ